jgi:hypothetical protein
VIHYQYRHDRGRRTLRGIDEQVRKAERAVDGHAPVKRNRYIQLTGATKSVNRTLEAKTRALAGWKGYTTNLVGQPADFVIDAYHQLWRIEKAFRMSKHDLQARPIYHRTHDSIEAAPERRVCCHRCIALDRDPNRLEHQEIHTCRSALPHRDDPSRQPHPDRRRTSASRPRRSLRQDRCPTCALA